MKRKRGRPPKLIKRRRTDFVPKFRPNALTEFLKYSKRNFLEHPQYFPLCYSLISENFRQKVKEMEEFNALNLSVNLNADNPEDSHHPFGRYSRRLSNGFRINENENQNDFKLLTVLLKFAEYSTVEIDFYNDYDRQIIVGRELIQNFAKFCREFKASPSIEKICVNFKGCEETLKTSMISLFLDLLPSNKSLAIKSSCDVSSFSKRQEKIMEKVSIYDLLFDKYTSQLFKTHTKNLVFCKSENPYANVLKLHHLGELGPFSPNLSLQTLEIGVSLYEAIFDPDSNRDNIPIKKWNNQMLPLCFESLKTLRRINANLELQLKSNEGFDVTTSEEAIKCHEIQLQRAKQIIDMAQEFNFKIGIFSINTDIWLFSTADAQKFSIEFAENTKMKVLMNGNGYQKIPLNLIEYNGIEISLEIGMFSCQRR